MSKILNRFSLLFAMEKEAAPLIAALALKPVLESDPLLSRLPFRYFRGPFKGREITVTVLGQDPRFEIDVIGTEPAAVAALTSIQKFKPDLLISAGTCGSFSAFGATIGRVYLSDSHFYFHDHRIPLPRWDEMGKGKFPAFNASHVASQTGLPRANVSSGNSLDYTAQDLESMHANNAHLKEMEAGGIAWVAQMTQTPLLAIKSVTNLIDTHPDSPSEFQRNFSEAVRQLTEKTLLVLEALSE